MDGRSFLEAQAKARGMTVSEMMRERSIKANKSKSGFASMPKDKLRELHEKSKETRRNKEGNQSA